MRSRHSSWTFASQARRKRVPSQAASAPRASTAASPRPSAMPPAAITGTGATASTTAGTSGSVATCRAPGHPPPSPAPRSRPRPPLRRDAPRRPTRRYARAAHRPRGSPRHTDPDPPESRHRRHGFLRAHRHAISLVPRQYEVHAEGTIRQRTGAPNAGSHVIRRRPGQRQHAQAASVRHGSRELGSRRAADRRLNERNIEPETPAERRFKQRRARRDRDWSGHTETVHHDSPGV